MFTIDDYCCVALTTKTPLLCFGALGLTDADVFEICAALEKNPCVEILQLFSNGITREGAYKIAALILSNPNIKDIDLSNNKIDQAGQDAIHQAIQKSQRMVEVNFDNNTPVKRDNLSLGL